MKNNDEVKSKCMYHNNVHLNVSKTNIFPTDMLINVLKNALVSKLTIKNGN